MGGPGSGHWRHAGRKGKRGGSAPSGAVALGTRLLDLRGQMATAAQKVYDDWQPDEEGFDIEFGGGGICDSMANSIGDVIVNELDADIFQAGQPGDDHAYLIAHKGNDAYIVDIPPYVYEVGGGYSWEKIEGVKIDPSDVIVEKIPEEDIGYILAEEY